MFNLLKPAAVQSAKGYAYAALAAFALLTSASYATEIDQQLPHLPSTKIDVVNYDLSYSFARFAAEDVPATAKITIKLLEDSADVRLHTDGDRMKITKASIGGSDVPYKIINGKAGKRLNGHVLKVELPTPGSKGDEVVIDLAFTLTAQGLKGNKRTGMQFRSNFQGEPIFATLAWPYHSRKFFPGHDHPGDPATFNIKLSVPQGYQGAANGQLVGGNYREGSYYDWDSGLKVFEWQQKTPIPTYGAQIGVSKFDIQTDTICFNRGKVTNKTVSCSNAEVKVPFVYYIQQAHRSKDRLINASKAGRAAAVYYSTMMGDYEYGKLGFLTAPHSFNMESVSLIVMLNAGATVHEVAHHWWGNTIYIEHWGEFWISEGFTTFFTTLYNRENRLAERSFLPDTLNGRACIDPKPKGKIRNPITTDPMDIFDNVAYCTGASAVNYLKVRLGKLAGVSGSGESQLFHKFARKLYQDYKFKRLGSRALVAYLKKNLAGFFKDNGHNVSQSAIDSSVGEWERTWFINP